MPVTYVIQSNSSFYTLFIISDHCYYQKTWNLTNGNFNVLKTSVFSNGKFNVLRNSFLDSFTIITTRSHIIIEDDQRVSDKLSFDIFNGNFLVSKNLNFSNGNFLVSKNLNYLIARHALSHHHKRWFECIALISPSLVNP